MEEKTVEIEVRNIISDEELENAIFNLAINMPVDTSITFVNEQTCSEIMIRARGRKTK